MTRKLSLFSGDNGLSDGSGNYGERRDESLADFMIPDFSFQDFCQDLFWEDLLLSVKLRHKCRLLFPADVADKSESIFPISNKHFQQNKLSCQDDLSESWHGVLISDNFNE